MLEDEAEPINFGFPTETKSTETKLHTFSVENFYSSAMADYPFNYKFTSIEIAASTDSIIY